MDGLVKDLKGLMAAGDQREDCLVMNSHYTSLTLETKNFHPINPMLAGPKHDGSCMAGKMLLFVDGGNGILFESAAFCIGMIRIAGVSYSANKRVERNGGEFYISVHDKGGKYHVKTYPANPFNDLIFDPYDDSLRNGIEKCTLSRIVTVIRRLCEIKFASDNSEMHDYVILDGTLEARSQLELEYLKGLFSKGRACAISKTCTLATKNGVGITKKLQDMSMHSDVAHDSWYYNPIVTSNNPLHKADIYFVKLNNHSKHVFRFEVQGGFKGDVDELLSILSSNSRDPVFMGYPYGLIDVDQYARVSDDESRLLQMRLSVKLGKDWNEFSKNLTSTNAHSILDKIKF